MPVLPVSFMRRFNRKSSQKELEDRAARQAEQTYKQMGYSDEAAEGEAQTDYDLAQRIKRKRGLANLRAGTPN